MSISIQSRILVLLGAFSFLFLSSGFAAEQSASLSTVEKAKVHLLLSQTKDKNMRAMGKGMHNYADPITNPYDHFKSDINPWIMMGAQRGDSANPNNRIKAYVADLESGIIAAHDLWPSLTQADIAGAASTDLPRVWSKLLEDEKSKGILDVIGGEAEVTEKALKKPLKTIRKRLQKLY